MQDRGYSRTRAGNLWCIVNEESNNEKKLNDDIQTFAFLCDPLGYNISFIHFKYLVQFLGKTSCHMLHDCLVAGYVRV